MTSLDDKVLVASHKNQNIEVYDALKFELKCHITVPGDGKEISGLAACGDSKCLYTSSGSSHNVCRFELTDSNEVKNDKKWSTAKNPTGLSVNIAHNLVVACFGAHVLQEYTTEGIIVREISLQAGATSPCHAVQLSTGDYVVCRHTSPGAVCIVGLNGQVVHSYGHSQTLDVGELETPTSLAVTSSNNILVADQYNNRILLMNSSLSSVEELALSVGRGIQRPCVLCVDQSRGKFYVGEFRGFYRLLVFDAIGL